MSTVELPTEGHEMEDIQRQDPYDWSVNQVVEALCNPESPFLKSSPRPNLPDLSLLGRCLQDNQVDGTTLLTGIDSQELKDDLGLKILGQRTTILNVIRLLRARSAKYYDNAPSMGLPVLDVPRFTTPVSRQTSVPDRNFLTLQSPAQGSQYERSASVVSVATPTTLNGFANPSGEVAISSSSYDETLPCHVDMTKKLYELPESDSRPLHTPDIPAEAGSASLKRQASVPDFSVAENGQVPPFTRNDPVESDLMAIDGVLSIEGGKKRRRVELQPVLDSEALRQNAFFASDENQNAAEPQPPAESTEDLSAVNLFFPPDEEHEFVDPEAFTLVTNHSGQYEDPKAWYGSRVYVNRRFKYMTRQRTIGLGIHEGQKSTALVLYPHNLVRNPAPQYIKVYVQDKGRISVRKDPLCDWPDLEAEHHNASRRVRGLRAVQRFRDKIEFDRFGDTTNPFTNPVADEEAYWLRLAQRYQIIQSHNDANPLPAYGELDPDGVYDSEEDREAQTIMQAPQKAKQLSKQEVLTAVSEAIEMRVEKWRTERLPRMRRGAWKLWTRSRDDVKAYVYRVQQELNSADARIIKFRTPIGNESYTAVEDVYKACETLDASVEDREECKWKLHVLNLRHAPSKPPRIPKTERVAKLPSRPLDLADDEEIIEKESIPSSESDMDDFVIDDLPRMEPADPIFVAAEMNAADIDASNFADDEDAMDVEDTVNVEDAMEMDGKDLHTPEPEEDDDSDDGPISSQARRQRNRNALLSHMEIGADSNNYLSVQVPESPSSSSKPTSDIPHSRTPVDQKKPDMIDLTISSQESSKESRRLGSNSNSARHKRETDEDGDFRTQPPRLKFMHKDEPPNTFKKPPYGWLVENETSGDSTPTSSLNSSSLLEATHMTYDELENHKDRRRLLYKLIIDMPEKRQGILIKMVPKMIFERTLKDNIWAALQVLGNDQDDVEAMSTSINISSMTAALLWISWVTCDSMHEKSGIPLRLITAALNYEENFDGYVSFLASILERIKNDAVVINGDPQREKKKTLANGRSLRGTNIEPGTPSEQTSEDRSSIELLPSNLTPHNKRKNAIKVDKKALASRKDAQRRVKDSQRAQGLVMGQLSREGVSNSDADHQAVSFKDPTNVIYLHPDIGRLVKPHQLRGIQFMWRELVEDKRRQGCLLAHTMGLGKTMQVISLLVTIAIGLKSTDPAVRKQLPSSWKKPNALILCPPGLVDNWLDELAMWTPKPIRDFLIEIYCVRSEVSGRAAIPPNLAKIAEWHEKGGVLVMSYEYFRTLALNQSTATRSPPLTPVQYSKLERELIKGPDIIVADEAHKLKKLKTKISEAAGLFRSQSRIALTGSPLANNLEEYYAEISWIAPGYLGDAVEFRSKYVEPIAHGLYADSTAYEKRRAILKLSILNKNLGPKINRADITCMQSDLPSKTEFVITITLTPAQKKAYDIFVVAHGNGGEISQTRLFDCLHMLSLVCHHPQCFKDRLESRADAKPKRRKALGASRRDNSDDDTSGASDNDIAEPSTSGMSKELVAELLLHLESIPNLKSFETSNRTRILLLIIQESIKADDKVLIFSQSIHTLDYLEGMLGDERISSIRLDGTTNMASRQATAKSFNQVDSRTSVFLISTKAGGLGLNLYGANRVVIFDYGFNPTWEEQAVGRAYRFGQRKPVFVYRFKAGGTFEDVIEMKTIFKTQLASRVVDKKNPIRYATKSVKDYLFPVKDLEQKDLEEFRGKDPEVLDQILNQKLQCIKALDLTETFHIEEDEKLSAEEEKEVQWELEGETLKRSNPQLYEQWLETRRVKEMSTRVTLPPNLGSPPGLSPAIGMSTHPTSRIFPPLRSQFVPTSAQSSQSVVRALPKALPEPVTAMTLGKVPPQTMRSTNPLVFDKPVRNFHQNPPSPVGASSSATQGTPFDHIYAELRRSFEWKAQQQLELENIASDDPKYHAKFVEKLHVLVDHEVANETRALAAGDGGASPYRLFQLEDFRRRFRLAPPKSGRVHTSSADKPETGSTSRAGVGASVIRSHQPPLPDQTEGFERGSGAIENDGATGDRADWQVQLNGVGESSSAPTYTPEHSQILRSTRNAVDSAFAAYSNVAQPPSGVGDTDSKEIKSAFTKVWKGPFAEALDKTDHRGRSLELERQGMLQNGLEIDWLAENASTEDKRRRKIEEAQENSVAEEDTHGTSTDYPSQGQRLVGGHEAIKTTSRTAD